MSFGHDEWIVKPIGANPASVPASLPMDRLCGPTIAAINRKPGSWLANAINLLPFRPEAPWIANESGCDIVNERFQRKRFTDIVHDVYFNSFLVPVNGKSGAGWLFEQLSSEAFMAPRVNLYLTAQAAGASRNVWYFR
jgi:hypothetical protein